MGLPIGTRSSAVAKMPRDASLNLHASKFCMKLNRLILMKIIKTVATRCLILRLKCTKFDFGWGSAPDPAGGAYMLPRPPIWISGLLLREGGKGEGKGRGVEGKGKEGRYKGSLLLREGRGKGGKG